jgi:hypothetical protein
MITDWAQIVKVFVALSKLMIPSWIIELALVTSTRVDQHGVAIKYTIKEIDVRCSSSETILKYCVFLGDTTGGTTGLVGVL